MDFIIGSHRTDRDAPWPCLRVKRKIDLHAHSVMWLIVYVVFATTTVRLIHAARRSQIKYKNSEKKFISYSPRFLTSTTTTSTSALVGLLCSWPFRSTNVASLLPGSSNFVSPPTEVMMGVAPLATLPLGYHKVVLHVGPFLVCHKISTVNHRNLVAYSHASYPAINSNPL